MMNKNGFSRCAEFYIGRLRKEGRHSTAHVYKNALFSFSKFCGTSNVSFRQITRERLRRYGQYLYECGLKPNTISTYMRMLRSIYNRGVEAGSAPYVPRLFHDVYTGVDVRQKKALPATELYKLLYEDPKSERLRRTQAIAALMFQFCGMSFADLAHLEKSALDQNVLRYNRIKTKTPMSVEVLNTAKEMINQLLQRIIKSTESGLIFPVTSFIRPFFIPTKNIKQIIRTVRMRIFFATELVNHFLCSIQHFHAHRSFGFDTIVSQHILIQSRLLQMG